MDALDAARLNRAASSFSDGLEGMLDVAKDLPGTDGYDLLHALEPLKGLVHPLAEALRGMCDEPAQLRQGEWDSFVAGHAELQTLGRLEFTDDDVVSALAEAPERERVWYAKFGPRPRKPSGSVLAHSVLRVLYERAGRNVDSPTDRRSNSDRGRVVAALCRLEKAGRVKQTRQYVSGGYRTSSLWAVDDDA